MPYTIVQAQLPLIWGAAGHNLIVVKDESGNVVREFDGLATGSDGQIKPIGYMPSDTLKVYEFNAATYYSTSEKQQVVFSGTYSEVLARVASAETCKDAMNASNMSYPFLGLGKNSNSVDSTMLKCMGIVETDIPGGAWIMPGVGDILLPQATINSILSTFGITSPTIAGFDTGTLYDTYFADPSAPDMEDNFAGGACVAVSSLLPGGLTARDATVGAVLQLADEKTLEPGKGTVSYSQTKDAAGFRITTESGVSLVCSDTAPIPTPEGLVLAPYLLGKKVPVRRDDASHSGGPTWESVTAVEAIGPIKVQHITVGDKCFWAGEKPNAYILHHNLKDEGGGGWDYDPYGLRAPGTGETSSASAKVQMMGVAHSHSVI